MPHDLTAQSGRVSTLNIWAKCRFVITHLVISSPLLSLNPFLSQFKRGVAQPNRRQQAATRAALFVRRRGATKAEFAGKSVSWRVRFQNARS
jgi:hypothetical protein